MKTVSKYLLSGMIVGLVFMSSERAYSVTQIPLAVSATQQEIVLTVDKVAAGEHWSVAIQPSESLSNSFTVKPGSVVSMSTHRAGTYPADGIQPLSKANYTLSDSSCHLHELSGMQKSIYLIAQVPLGKVVSVVQNGIPVFQGKITVPILLVDGNILSNPSMADLKAVMMLMVPRLIDDEFGPDLTQDDKGAWIASTDALRRHLVSLPASTGPFTNVSFDQVNGEMTAVLLRLHIDANGRVTNVSIANGNSALASDVSDAVSGAVFKPFLLNGKPAEVDAFLQYSLDKSGTLTTNVTE
jgi:hypothetical protein